MDVDREALDAAVDEFLIVMEDADRPGSEPVTVPVRKRRLALFGGPTFVGSGWQIIHVRHPSGGEPEISPLFLLETGDWVATAWYPDVDVEAILAENMAGILSALAWLLDLHGLRTEEDGGTEALREGSPFTVHSGLDLVAAAVVEPEPEPEPEPEVAVVTGADREWAPEDPRRASASLLIGLAAAYHGDLHPDHLTDLVALAAREMAEAVPPYESVRASERAAGAWVVEDPIVSVAALRDAVVAAPEQAEALLRTVAVCLVTTEERGRLTEAVRECPDLWGWRRYVAAGVAVAGADAAELAARLDEVWSSHTRPPSMSTVPISSPSTPQTV